MADSAMPRVPAKEDILGTWAYLEAGCNKVMYHLADGVDMQTYMQLYSAVHNYCTAQPPSKHNVITSGGQQGSRGAHLIGDELYSRLKAFLKRHLDDIYQRGKSHHSEALLTYYIKEWERYTLAAKNINHLFKYLNRHWVKREIDEGKKDVYDVYTLHLVMWKREFFMKVHEDIMNAVLKLIEKQRLGETIDQSMIRSVVQSFVSLGLDESDTNKTTLDVYKYYFAKPFLDATAQFYMSESTAFLAENTVVDFMKKAESRLEEEKMRVDWYLNPDTHGDLMKTSLKALVEDHAMILRDEFQRLLDADKQEDLARMYRLLNRVSGGLDPLRTRFEDHVRRAGEQSVETAASQGENIEPKVYVDALLAVYIRYEKLVKDAFNGEAEFVRSLDNACKEFVNRNKVCTNNSSKSPELLSKYTDALLKRGKEDEGDMEELQKRLMTIFRFIEDKDVFYKFYQRALAKRLIHATSVSDEAEVNMISKLKEVCGFEYTNKLQRMFQDIQTSKDLNRDYQSHLAQSNEDGGSNKDLVDATYSILGTSFWPLPPSTTNFTPPPEIIRTYQRFKTYYDNKHTGRKLNWQWNLCKGEVKSTFLKGLKNQHIFQVSTYQMAVLCLFNEYDTVKYEDMLSATQLDKDVLDQSIAIMIKAKLMIPSPANGKMEAGTVYSLNESFKYKKVKVNFQTSIKTEQKAEETETHKTIEEDRKLLLQSAIVRIMKSRKTMKHTLLVQETIGQVKSRFKPQVPDIKKAIDQLIDKEYLERQEDDLLGYLA